MVGVERNVVKYSQAGLHGETPLNIDLVINYERQDCKTGTVYVEGY